MFFFQMRSEWKQRLSDVQLACIKVMKNCVTSACAADGCEQILGGIGPGGGVVAPEAGLSKLTTVFQRHNLIDAIKYISTSTQQSTFQGPPSADREVLLLGNTGTEAMSMVEDFTVSSESFSPSNETMHPSSAAFSIKHPFEMQM